MAPVMIPRRLSMKTLIILAVQCIIMLSVIKMWITYNGGLVPSFLWRRSPKMNRIGLGANVAHFFPNAKGDGIHVTWEHAVNSQDRLKNALAGSVMCLEADVILRNEGTTKQELLPVMAHPPAVDSDLTLVLFIETVLATRPPRAIKLDFKSLASVELSLEILRSKRKEFSVPLWLNADILSGPNSPSAANVIDATAFLSKTQTIMPGCTLSLGWTTQAVTDSRQVVSTSNRLLPAAYSWADVKNMYDVLKRSGLTTPRDGPDDSSSPVTFAVRAALMRGSTAPLKWLCEQVGGSLTVFSSSLDVLSAADMQELLYLRLRMPPDHVYYDMPPETMAAFRSLVDDGPERHIGDDHRLQRQRTYQHKDWAVAVFHESSELLAGEDAVMLRGRDAFIRSVSSFTYGTHVHVIGSVRFVPFVYSTADQPNSVATSLEIYTFATRLTTYGEGPKDGIRCSISTDGRVAISNGDASRRFIQEEKVGMLPAVTPNGCYQFEMTISAQGQISFYVQVPTADCHVFKVIDKYSFKNVELSVGIIERAALGTQYEMFLRSSDLSAYVVLEQLTLSSGRPS